MPGPLEEELVNISIPAAVKDRMDSIIATVKASPDADDDGALTTYGNILDWALDMALDTVNLVDRELVIESRPA
jgi:hypothetical protein